jgi:dihydroorotate dehydrogenase (fumarate)
MMSADLATRYLGHRLRSPIVASAGPLTGRMDMLVRLQDAGVAAVVLPSLFEEELVGESLRLHETLEQGAGASAEAASYFPDADFSDLGPERHVRLVEQAKARLDIPVIASVNAVAPGSWARYARLMVEAGADAIELNLYSVPGDPARTADEVEGRYLDAIGQVTAVVRVPVAVKLSPFFTSTGHFALEAVAAGANGLVLFNRFYQPDLDLDTLQVLPVIELSQPWELRLPMRWIAILRGRLPGTSLAATTGIHRGKDAARALLVGADVVMMTSALLTHGPDHVRVVERELLAWLDDRDYQSVSQLRGSVCQSASADPTAFERANYIRVLSSIRVPPDL